MIKKEKDRVNKKVAEFGTRLTKVLPFIDLEQCVLVGGAIASTIQQELEKDLDFFMSLDYFESFGGSAKIFAYGFKQKPKYSSYTDITGLESFGSIVQVYEFLTHVTKIQVSKIQLCILKKNFTPQSLMDRFPFKHQQNFYTPKLGVVVRHLEHVQEKILETTPSAVHCSILLSLRKRFEERDYIDPSQTRPIILGLFESNHTLWSKLLGLVFDSSHYNAKLWETLEAYGLYSPDIYKIVANLSDYLRRAKTFSLEKL